MFPPLWSSQAPKMIKIDSEPCLEVRKNLLLNPWVWNRTWMPYEGLFGVGAIDHSRPDVIVSETYPEAVNQTRQLCCISS